MNTKLNEYQKHSINKTVRKVVNTMFNIIIWGNYSLSKIDEFTNSNIYHSLTFKNSGWANIEHEWLLHKQQPTFNLYQANELPYNWAQSQ